MTVNFTKNIQQVFDEGALENITLDVKEEDLLLLQHHHFLEE